MIQDTDQDILVGHKFWTLCAEKAAEEVQRKIGVFQDLEACSIDVPKYLYIVIYAYNDDACKNIPYKVTLKIDYENYRGHGDLEMFKEFAYKEFEKLKTTKIVVPK